MSIEEEVKRALAENERQNNPAFQHLRDFYEQKKMEGVVTRQEYTLPPMDTLGRSLHVAQAVKDEKDRN